MNLILQARNILQQPLVATIIAILTTLYGGLVAPPLPNFIKKIFNNVIGRTIWLILILYYTTNNINVAILVSIVYTIIISNLHTEQTIENFII